MRFKLWVADNAISLLLTVAIVAMFVMALAQNEEQPIECECPPPQTITITVMPSTEVMAVIDEHDQVVFRKVLLEE